MGFLLGPQREMTTGRLCPCPCGDRPCSAWEMIPAPKGHFPPGETVVLGVVTSLRGMKATFPLPPQARCLTVSHQVNTAPLLSAAL